MWPSIRDVLALFRAGADLKQLSGLPKRVSELEGRLKDAERLLADRPPPPVCPTCLKHSLIVARTMPHPDNAGEVIRTMMCDGYPMCRFQEEWRFDPSKAAGRSF